MATLYTFPAPADRPTSRACGNCTKALPIDLIGAPYCPYCAEPLGPAVNTREIALAAAREEIAQVRAQGEAWQQLSTAWQQMSAGLQQQNAGLQQQACFWQQQATNTPQSSAKVAVITVIGTVIVALIAAAGLIGSSLIQHRSKPEQEPGKLAKSSDDKKHAPLRKYYVEPGDTLSSIALRKLGSASRASEIYSLNQKKLPRGPMYVQSGQVLLLPPF